MYGRHRHLLIGFTTVLGFAVLATDVQATHSVSSGYDPAGALQHGVRYRNLAGSTSGGTAEIQVGNISGATPGVALGSTATSQVVWSTATSWTKAISITYDPASPGVLSTTVAGASPSTVNLNVGALSPLNYLVVTITKNTPTTTLAFNDITLNGHNPVSFALSGGADTAYRRFTGLDLSGGFTLTGTLSLTGGSGGGDSNFVQVDIGSVTPPDADGPVTTSLSIDPNPAIVNGDATVTANVDDTDTGGSKIASADYSLDGGPWTSMAAQDGDFDEVSEDVEATLYFSEADVGSHEVCVSGTDEPGNIGDEVCDSFMVTYNFEGFFTPIDNNYVNTAKAGQAVPAKWRLTDANGDPIEDPGSFWGMYSYEMPCEGGTPTDVVEEYAAGSSGLQYNGDGYWQFNWKTPKTYADKCRALYFEFASGVTSPVALFKFKK